MAKFLGGSLQDGVASQLTARSTYLKKGDFNKGLSALHGNTPFINLYSSVSGTGHPAVFSKLEGGLAFSSDKADGTPVGYSGYVGDDQRSFTPRPGIIDAKVKSKGTFGALRDVEVTIKAFNIADFDMVYDFYCRPGFSFFLEWGHSVYLTNAGGVATTKQTASSTFVNGGKYEAIQKAISTARVNSGYNYDAIVAICKNFSWTFNADGTYDVNVSLISKGEIIESLKSNFDPAVLEKGVAALVAGNADKTERKSPLHYFCKRIELNNKDGALIKGACQQAIASTSPGFASRLDADTLYAWSATGFDIKQATSFFDKDCVFVYLSLRTVLTVLNASMMWVGQDQRAVKFKTKKDGEYNNYFTHAGHHSINPFVCVIPNLNGTNAQFEAKPAGKDLHKQITSALSNSDDVLDICISNLYLYEKLDPIYDDDQEGEKEPGVFDVLKAILGGVTEALGGVNELDLDYDEEADEWAIVDRKCKLSGKAKTPSEIDLVGLGSFAYDFKTESKITNKLASQVSIAAQAGGSGTKQNVAEMLQWNRGHYDKIFPRKNEGPDQQDKDAKDATLKDMKDKAEWNDRCKEAFDKFNGTGFFTDQQYDPDLFKGIQSGHQTYQSRLVPATCSNEGIPAPGTIPVELSFTILGIGGFRIGETFKLSEATSKILPKAYSQGAIGFIITRVDHSIDEGGWKTEIGALMYNLAKLSGIDGASGALAASGASGGTAQPQVKPTPAAGSTDPAGTDKLQTQTALGTNVSYNAVKAAVLNKKYQWFSGELQLNIVGVRNSSGQQSDGAGGRKHPITNRFKDIVIVAWIENGKPFAESYPATTVPGASFTLSSNAKFAKQDHNPNGAGIMYEKQFINQYTPGMHTSHSSKPHLALRAVGPAKAHRDKDSSDNWITLAVSPVGKLGNAKAGLFNDGGGMQIHNSGARTGSDKPIDNWSAGCQVFANEKQHNRLMELVNKSQKATKTNKFSYVLINDKEIKL